MAASVETRDVVSLHKKLVKPDKVKHEAEVNAIFAEIEKLKERVVVIRGILDAARDGRSGMSAQFQEARTKMQEVRAIKDQLMAERSQLMAELKDSQSQLEEHSKTQKNLRQEIKYTSAKEIDAQIALLRHKQETQSMSLPEEKKVLKEMETLRKSKKLVDNYAGREGQIDRTRDSVQVIRAKLAEKNKELDAVTERISEQKKVLDGLRNSAPGDKDQIPILREEKKTIKTTLDAKFNDIRNLRNQFKELNNTYFAAVVAQREARKKAKEEEDKRMQEQYQEQLAQYEKEMEKLHPYQDEMDMCDALVAYLQSTFIKTEETNTTEANQGASSSRAIAMDGLEPFKREEEEYMSFGGKSKNKKGGKNNKKTQQQKIVLPLVRLDSFNTIGLTPPTFISQVPDTVKEIASRKEYLAGLTRETAPVKEETVSTPVTTSKPKTTANSEGKKSRNFDSNASASEFPTLGGAGVAQPTYGVWGAGNSSRNEDSVEETPEEIAA